jgi:hypothetical protein
MGPNSTEGRRLCCPFGVKWYFGATPIIFATTLRYSSRVGVSSHAKFIACPNKGVPVFIISIIAEDTSFEKTNESGCE